MGEQGEEGPGHHNCPRPHNGDEVQHSQPQCQQQTIGLPDEEKAHQKDEKHPHRQQKLRPQIASKGGQGDVPHLDHKAEEPLVGMLGRPRPELRVVHRQHIGRHHIDDERQAEGGHPLGLLCGKGHRVLQYAGHRRAQPIHQPVRHRLHRLRQLRRHQVPELEGDHLHLVQDRVEALQQPVPVLDQRDQLGPHRIAQIADPAPRQAEQEQQDQ